MCACDVCSTEQATRKYLNSTCYFVGPLMAPAVSASAALGRDLNATVAVTQVQDPWGSGAVLKAMQVRGSLPLPSIPFHKAGEERLPPTTFHSLPQSFRGVKLSSATAAVSEKGCRGGTGGVPQSIRVCLETFQCSPHRQTRGRVSWTMVPGAVDDCSRVMGIAASSLGGT